MIESLSEREKEIAAHLAVGRRVASVARELCLSEHTIRNHLKRAFSKLDVHRQSELVDLVRRDPSLVSPYDAIVGHATRSGREVADDIMEVDRKMEDRVEAVADAGSGVERMRAILHTVLPLDETRRREWRTRLEAFARGPEEPAVHETARELQAKWAEKPLRRIEEFQSRGWITSALDPADVRRKLASAVYASVMALLANPSDEEQRRQLDAMDRLVDEIASDEARGAGEQPRG